MELNEIDLRGSEAGGMRLKAAVLLWVLRQCAMESVVASFALDERTTLQV